MRYNRESGLFITMTAMIVSLFISRAALSSSIIAFLLVSLAHGGLRQQLRDFISKPLLWGMSLLFLLPFVSGLWSENLNAWKEVMQVKLPLLLLPIAFAGEWKFTQLWWTRLGYVFLSVLVIASGWTVYHYLLNFREVHDWYLQARTMITPLENDHVRFSWIIAVGILLCGYFVAVYWSKDRALAILFLVMLTWFIIFLHILAARTGLLVLYFMMAATATWLIVTKLKWWIGLMIVVLMVGLPVVAYESLPSFRNRVNYTRYELDFFREASYLPGSNDAVRIISMKAGWQLVKNDPLKGSGYGDIMDEMNRWYGIHVPGIDDRDRIFPSNQYLMYGAGTGVVGLVSILFCVIIPFTVPVRKKLVWWILNAAVAIGFLFDIGLEVQFGVFIYSFTILWWYAWLGRREA